MSQLVAATIDPCFADLLADTRNAMRPPSTGKPMNQFRNAMEATMIVAKGPSVHAIDALTITGPVHDIGLRLYRPGPESDLPIILFCHGGGFVIGSFDTHDAMCRELAVASGAAVIAVEYRRAPEHVYPAALDDCHAAIIWIADHARDLGLDPAQIAVCGDSAGGNLAFSTAMLSRDHGLAIGHVGLIYPLIDPLCESVSARSLGQGYLLTLEMVRWFWACYLGEANDVLDPMIAPLNAELIGLPPVTILTAEFDPLRDEGELLARQLRAAGISVFPRRYLGMIHGFVSMPDLTPMARRAIHDLASDIMGSFDALV